jgi:2-polyprenyl-6-methoxyphenol hydroxylase-like FAD-dependent oxidoreductase
MHDTVLIVGAGPTGLVLALWLTRLGIKVRIIDRLKESGTTSRALAVQARTLELYRQIGIADDVVNGGVKILGINLWVSGTKRARMPLGELGKGLSPFSFALVYPQDAHEKLLIAKLAELGVNVERETELVSLEQDANRVRAVLRTRSGEEKVEAAYAAGCDGASSTVRHQLGIGFPGGTYEGLFYVADVNAQGPVTDDELHVDLEDSDFLLVFPLQGKGNLRLVGYAGEDVRAQHDKLTFDDVKGRAVNHVRLENINVNWFSTYHVHHRVSDTFRRGRAFLLGDAAHVHSPVGGQGMNTGIGDAINLAWKLAQVLKGQAEASLLDSFEPERMAFAQRLVATTDRGFTIVTAKGRLAQFFRTKLVPLVAPYATRLPFMRRLLFRTVSQINVAYKGSPLSEGRAGRIQAGERLPWIETGGSDNFAPLTSLSWQVHIYGDATSELVSKCTELNIPVHVFPWTPAANRASLTKNATYLLRPDGYIALIDPHSSPETVRSYVLRHKLNL